MGGCFAVEVEEEVMVQSYSKNAHNQVFTCVYVCVCVYSFNLFIILKIICLPSPWHICICVPCVIRCAMGMFVCTLVYLYICEDKLQF